MGPANATSPFLKAEVDQKKHWDDSTVKKFVSPKILPAIVPVVPVGVVAVAADSLQVYAKSFFDKLSQPEKDVLPKSGLIPKDLDAALLAEARNSLKRLLTEPEKRNLRAELRKLL